MSRAALLALAVGLAGLATLAALAASGQPVLPSYLAAWLFVLALPVGALPWVLGHDLLRRSETPVVATLRAMLPLMALAIVMAVPVALGRASLYPTAATTTEVAAAWMRPGLVTARGAAALLLWGLLAFAARRPPAPRSAGRRSGLSGLGLMLHLVLGTLAAGDWVGALDPGLSSASLGPTVLVAQAGIALAAAALLGRGRPAAAGAGLPAALICALGAWLFFAFTQYLVVWSANLPDEVPWYIARSSGLGGPAVAAGGVLALVAAALLLWPRAGAGLVALAAGCILLLHLGATFWLVVPAARGAFTPAVADALAAVGALGLAAGCLVLLAHRKAGGARARA